MFARGYKILALVLGDVAVELAPRGRALWRGLWGSDAKRSGGEIAAEEAGHLTCLVVGKNETNLFICASDIEATLELDTNGGDIDYRDTIAFLGDNRVGWKTDLGGLFPRLVARELVILRGPCAIGRAALSACNEKGEKEEVVWSRWFH